MSDDVESANAGGQGDDRPPGWRLTRRAFLAGCAAVAGTAAVAGKIVDDTFLGGLQPAAADAPAVPEQLVRTGHSNNCDGACGHLVHVVDGKVKLVEGAPYGTTTIAGTPVPTSYPPRICLRGVSQLENLYSADRIKYPYKRVGERGSGQWQRISWDEATTTIAENCRRSRTSTARTSVWIAPYTGSLSLLEGVVGVGFRFASAIGAWPATSRATTKATAPRPRAGTTCSSTRPTRATAAASSTATSRPTSSTPRRSCSGRTTSPRPRSPTGAS